MRTIPKREVLHFGEVIPTGYTRIRRRGNIPSPSVPQGAVSPPALQTLAPETPATPNRVQQAYRRIFGPVYGDLLSQVLDWKNIGRVVQIAARDLGSIGGFTCEMKAKQKSLEEIERLLNENNNRRKDIYAQIAEKENQGGDPAAIGALRREISGLYEERDELSVRIIQLQNEIIELRKRLEDIPFYIIPRNTIRNITDSFPFSRVN